MDVNLIQKLVLKLWYNIQNPTIYNKQKQTMSGKRDRDFQIDQQTLEYKNKNKETDKKDNKSSPEEIANRKIFKIKKSEPDVDSSQKKVKFVFTQSETNNTDKKGNGQKQQDRKPNITAQQKQKPKQVQKKQENGVQNQEQKKEGEKVEEKEGVKVGEKEGDKKNQTKPFSFANNNNFSMGIFGNSQTTTGSFPGNIFQSNSNKSMGEGLFAKKSTDGNKSSIFNFSTGSNSKNIFNFSSSVPPIKNSGGPSTEGAGGEEEDAENSVQLQREQNAEIDPTKSSGKYQYESEYEIVFRKKANKVKKNQQNVIENLQIVLQKDKSKEMFWLIARILSTKANVTSGLLLKGISQVKNFNSKHENICVSVFNPPNPEIPESKMQKITLKIQFQQSGTGKQLMDQIEKIIKKE